MHDIYTNGDLNNPTLSSPNDFYSLGFYITKDDTIDVDGYKRFLENAISRFRRSRTYTNYKSFLISLGMDKCQLHGNIDTDMDVTIEMHHNMLTIFDIALTLSEYTLNTTGVISSFDLVELLKKVHTNHQVQLVMLSATVHQLHHNTSELFIHPKMCIGDWVGFLREYKLGLTPEVCTKLIHYVNKAADLGDTDSQELLKTRDVIADWSHLN